MADNQNFPTRAADRPRRSLEAVRALPAPSRRLKLTPWLVLGLAGFVGLGSGSTAAWWSTAGNTPALGFVPSLTGFGVQRAGGASDVATSRNDSVGFQLTSTDAKALVASPDRAIAISFTVKAMTSGTGGIDYSIAVTQPSDGTFWSKASLDVFPQGEDGCTITAEPGDIDRDQLSGDYVGVAANGTPRPAGTVSSQDWCLVASWQPGQYVNEATASGTDDFGAALESETVAWQVFITPDLTTVTPGEVTLTHTPTRYGGLT